MSGFKGARLIAGVRAAGMPVPAHGEVDTALTGAHPGRPQVNGVGGERVGL